MTWHPSEDELILHFYGEGHDAGNGRLTDHLETCAPCKASWIDLCEMLKLVDTAPAPEPGPEFERVMWARIQPALPKRRAWLFGGMRLVPLLSAAAVVVIAVAVGARMWQRQAPAAGTPATAKAQTAPGERVLLAALDEHFETTETLLVELLNNQEAGQPANADDFSFMQATAGELVSSGRLYRVTATHNGDVQFARMLDDLEPVLVDVARAPKPLDHQDLQSLRARIDDASLLFKVRALSKEIQDREKKTVLGAE